MRGGYGARFALAAVAAALVALGLAGGYSTDSYLGRWIWWNRSDVGDLHRFPSRPIANGPRPAPFAEAPSQVDPVVQVERDGEPVRVRLSELARRDSGFARITLHHLVDMRSGIEFRDHDLPWGDKARAYYDPHLRERVLEEIGIEGPPGEEWVYNTYNPQLLGLALERASGETVADFTSSRLWKPLGAEYPASWSLDGATAPMEKMESGLNARAVDFAKIGRILLAEGSPSGRRIVAEEWVAASTRPEPACELEAFRPRRVCYQLGWWITPAGSADEATRHAVEGRGHLGQYVSVFPDDRLVMVRFGRETGEVSWPAVFQAVANHVAP